ncbi:MAG: hypothetical protein AB1666_14870 [Pseudomonadota bacterium]
MPEEEKRLRKEWLKRKFASFEYHEEMLRLHHQWVEVIRKAKYWTPMARMAQNIRYTVDDMWTYEGTDDWILDERYTGPIDWPDDWRAEVSQPGIKAGEPAPQGGVWQSVDEHKRQLRVQPGERLPDLGSAYGITLWERIGD